MTAGEWCLDATLGTKQFCYHIVAQIERTITSLSLNWNNRSWLVTCWGIDASPAERPLSLIVQLMQILLGRSHLRLRPRHFVDVGTNFNRQFNKEAIFACISRLHLSLLHEDEYRLSQYFWIGCYIKEKEENNDMQNCYMLTLLPCHPYYGWPILDNKLERLHATTQRIAYSAWWTGWQYNFSYSLIWTTIASFSCRYCHMLIIWYYYIISVPTMSDSHHHTIQMNTKNIL